MFDLQVPTIVESHYKDEFVYVIIAYKNVHNTWLFSYHTQFSSSAYICIFQKRFCVFLT